MELLDIVNSCIDWLKNPELIKGLIINQAWTPFIIPFGISEITINSKDSIDLRLSDEFNESKYTNLPKNFTSLDYLNVASSIIHEFYEGEGECKEYSILTYKTYLRLIKLNNRSELKKSVRIVAGKYFGEISHMALEIKDVDQKFYPYETTMHTPYLLPEDVKGYSLNTRDDRKYYITQLWIKTFPGTWIFRPTWNIALYPGGAIGFSIKIIKDIILYKMKSINNISQPNS